MYKRNAQGWLKHIDFILWDMVVLLASFLIAYAVRFGAEPLPKGFLKSEYKSLVVVLAVADLLVSIIFNTMHNVMRRTAGQELISALKQAALVLLLMSLYLFSTQTGDTYSRLTLYYTAGLHFVLGFLFRLLWKALILRLNRNKKRDSMILVADEGMVPQVLSGVSDMDGFEYVGVVLSNRDAEGEVIGGVPVVASLSNAAEYICREWVDEVFIYPEHLSDLTVPSAAAGEAEAARDGKERSGVSLLMEQCREMALPVHVCLPISGVGGKSFIEKVGGYDVLTTTANYAGPFQLFLKRCLDILGGLVGSLAALLVIAIVGPKIKKESPGPVLFRQTRVGMNGKKFTFYKIRSMRLDADNLKKELMEGNRVSDGMMFKLDWDPRIIGNRIVDGKQVTGIGEKIRRSSLDEFPQFFNVLKGDMSLVGTRPPTEDEWEKYQYHHRARLACKPGITGMWQVSGRSEITDFEEVVRLDTAYINNWSFGLDIRILLKTVKAVLKHDGAM